MGEHGGHAAAAGEAGDEPVGELAREGLGLGTEARDVERDWMLEVDEVVLAHLEADGMRLAVEGVFHLVAREEGAHHLHVLTKRAEAHGLVAEGAHGGVAGAEADEAAAGGEAIDGGDAVGGHGGEAEPGHVHSGA